MYGVHVTLLMSVVISCITTWHLVPLIIRIAYKLGVIDNPDGKIKTHKVPTPYLGGVAVYAGFLISLAFIVPSSEYLSPLIIGSTLSLLLGLADDILVLTPLQKFLGQGLAAVCFLKSGLILKTDFFVNSFWHIPFAVLWVMTIINAFNLIDVMDGLATTSALCSSIGFMGVALMTASYDVAYILGAFSGALLGFLWYNKPQAQIYLGDAGSLFIGGLLSAIPFIIPWADFHSSFNSFFIPIIFLAVPLYEVTMLVCIRTWLGIPFYRASPHHFSIILQKRGWSKQHILFLIATISLGLITLVLFFS